MYEIPKDDLSDNFVRAWQAAKAHLDTFRTTHGLQWLRNHLSQPLVEHLSFRISNQLFFVFITGASSGSSWPRDKHVFKEACAAANAHPCILLMKGRFGAPEPAQAGWGLISGDTGKPIDPLELVSDELIEMSDWEVQDFANQVVLKRVREEGATIHSSQSNLGIDPQIFYEDTDGSHHWVVVRGVRYPAKEAALPETIKDVAAGQSEEIAGGYFASVLVANSDDPFDPDAASTGLYLPLYRGHALRARFLRFERFGVN